MFSTTLNVVHGEVYSMDEHLEIRYVVAITPRGPNGEQMMIPAGDVRIPISKQESLKIANEMLEQAEVLPDPSPVSDLYVPEGVEAADIAKKAKEGPDES